MASPSTVQKAARRSSVLAKAQSKMKLMLEYAGTIQKSQDKITAEDALLQAAQDRHDQRVAEQHSLMRDALEALLKTMTPDGVTGLTGLTPADQARILKAARVRATPKPDPQPVPEQEVTGEPVLTQESADEDTVTLPTPAWAEPNPWRVDGVARVTTAS